MGESHYEKVLKGFIIHNIHRVNVTSTYLEKKKKKALTSGPVLE